METEIEDKCSGCHGRGEIQDEHPHNGSPMGKPYKCFRCKGTGKHMRNMTDRERIKRLEEMMEDLEQKYVLTRVGRAGT